MARWGHGCAHDWVLASDGFLAQHCGHHRPRAVRGAVPCIATVLCLCCACEVWQPFISSSVCGHSQPDTEVMACSGCGSRAYLACSVQRTGQCACHKCLTAARLTASTSLEALRSCTVRHMRPMPYPLHLTEHAGKQRRSNTAMVDMSQACTYSPDMPHMYLTPDQTTARPQPHVAP